MDDEWPLWCLKLVYQICLSSHVSWVHGFFHTNLLLRTIVTCPLKCIVKWWTGFWYYLNSLYLASIDWSTLFIDWLIDWFSPLQTAWATLISFFFMKSLLKNSFCDFKQILLCKFLLQCQNIDGIFRDVLCI